MWSIMISENGGISASSCPIWMPYVSFSYLTVVVGAPNSTNMSNKSGDSWAPFLVPDFIREGFSFSPLGIMLPVSFFFLNGFYYLEIWSLFIYSNESFSHECTLNLVECFFTSFDMVMWVLFFVLSVCSITLINLWILN